jgi:hypothetical protein
VWREALEGWNMKDSPFLKDLEDKARSAGRAEMLLHFLERRFKAVPDDLRRAIAVEQDPQRLAAWADAALAARSLRAFRQEAGI